VLFRKVDDGNVELRRFSAEPGGDADAGGTAADNQYGIGIITEVSPEFYSGTSFSERLQRDRSDSLIGCRCCIVTSGSCRLLFGSSLCKSGMPSLGMM
jgi:hypothetical protein